MNKDEGAEAYLTCIESCFGVVTNDYDCNLVTKTLGISPTRSRQKGEQIPSDFSDSVGIARYGIWEISKRSIGADVSLEEQIDHFKNILGEKLESIKELKATYGFECVFYVLANTSDSVGGFELTSADLHFISNIADRFTYRVASGIQVKP